MKTINKALLVAVFMSFTLPGYCAEMGSSGGFDLDALWARVEAGYDLAGEDAVLLLEHRDVTWAADGTLTTRVHEVVWINTAVAIRAYADLRIPWDSATSSLDVAVLRTWRDHRWWPAPDQVSPTAVVPTLPYAVDQADDYTDMRETMLLHDGVELPCIMETVYTVTETGTPGTDGLFVMSRQDPAVMSLLTVAVPTDSGLKYEMMNGVSEPAVTERDGSLSLTWTMEDVPALAQPLTEAPAVFEPAVAWSTWPDWETLRDHWRGVFDEAAVLDPALGDSLQVWMEGASSRWGRLAAVTEAVNAGVRAVHYPDRFWRYAPRPAVRTWETAYGHSLDRAVLAAALFREAGYEITPIFVGPGNAFVGTTVPRLEDLGHLYLSIKGDPAGLYDPEAGTLTGQAPLIGRPVWRTDKYVEPFLGNSNWPNRLQVTLSLEPGQDGVWTGSGSFEGSGVFCPQGDMAGSPDRAGDYLAGVVSSVIPGVTLEGANPEVFHQHQVMFSFDLEMEAPEPPTTGPARLVAGAPGHGLADHAPGIHLYEDARTSPVLLPGELQQVVKIRLKLGDQAVHLPPTVALTNEAGTFAVTATSAGGWVTLERAITLNADAGGQEMWPALRALLLEDGDPANGTILLN